MSDHPEDPVTTETGGQAATPDDIRAAYLLLLTREPESASTFDHYAGKTRSEAFAQVLGSGEGKYQFDQVAIHGLVAQSHFSDEQESFLGKWIGDLDPATGTAKHPRTPEYLYLFALANAEASLPAEQRTAVHDLRNALFQELEGWFDGAAPSEDSRPVNIRDVLAIVGPEAAVSPTALTASIADVARPEAAISFSDYLFDTFGVLSLLQPSRIMRHSALAEYLRRPEIRDDVQANQPLSGRPADNNKDRDFAARIASQVASLGLTIESSLVPVLDGSRGEIPPSVLEKFSAEARHQANSQPADSLIFRWRTEAFIRRISAGLSNSGFMGNRALARSSRYFGLMDLPAGRFQPAATLVRLLLENSIADLADPGEESAISFATATAVLGMATSLDLTVDPNSKPLRGLSIVTVLSSSHSKLQDCAASIALAVKVMERMRGQSFELQWVLVTSDETWTEAAIRAETRALDLNILIVQSVGDRASGKAAGIRAATQDWIAILEPDSTLYEEAFPVLQYYADTLSCLLLSCGAIDLDETGRVVSFKGGGRRSANRLIEALDSHAFIVFHRTLLPAAGETVSSEELILDAAAKNAAAFLPEFLVGCQRLRDVGRPSLQRLPENAVEVRSGLLKLSGQAPRPFARSSDTACRRVGVIIRTTGNRNRSLAEAIDSCRASRTGVELLPIVVVHGNDERLNHVQRSLSGLGAHVNDGALIVAPETARQRGYVLNVGLEEAFDRLDCDAFGVLDDDDIYLPAIGVAAARLARGETQLTAGKTIVRDVDRSIQPFLPLRPAGLLTFENFLPTNAFLATRELALLLEKQFGTVFPEDIHYLEDWMFLLRSFSAGSRFDYVDEFVGEWRKGSDGNSESRDNPMEFGRSRIIVEQFARDVRGRLRREVYRSVLAFPQWLARESDPRARRQILSLVHGSEFDVS